MQAPCRDGVKARTLRYSEASVPPTRPSGRKLAAALTQRMGASQPARSLSVFLDCGPGSLPTRSLLCWLAADDDRVAAVSAGVDIADRDGPAVGFRGGNSAIASRRIATVSDDSAGAADRDVAIAAVRIGD